MAAERGPLRVAVVGAGPAGIYVADALITRSTNPVAVDLFDRLPTPYGLLRYGVAPDHLKMKSMVRALQRTLDDDRVQFFGNVSIGTDVTVAELLADYHAVVYSFGASVDRRLGIPGEDLPGSYSATQFVSWYCGHPDSSDDTFDLSGPGVAVIGLGNVALDVARVLLRNPEELTGTDVPDDVLDTLRGSAVTDVHIVGRRGAQHAKFTHKELREIGELDGVAVHFDPAALVGLDPAETPGVRHNLEVFQEWASRSPVTAPRRLHVHLGVRPVQVLGQDRVSGLRLTDAEGRSRELPVQLVFRSLGNIGLGVPGVPLDAATGTIPTLDHRVIGGSVPIGEYAAGWIKRGATGVIGTNRSDATDTVKAILADESALRARGVAPGSAAALLRQRGVRLVNLAGWASIDAAEVQLGSARDSPRVKVARWDDLLLAGGVGAKRPGDATCEGGGMTAPNDVISRDDFYQQDERRRTSHVLSYGSGWKQPSWSDESHVIELMWFGATHELVAYYITYDWDRLAPGQLNRDDALATGLELGVDSGYGVGRILGDQDLATSEIDVELLATLGSDLECHELLWGWRWWQHHPDGLDHVRERIRARSAS